MLCGHKTGDSNTTKQSIIKPVFVPTLTYGHESWVITERILSQVQAAEMRFLRKVHGVTLILLRIKRSQLDWFGHVSRMPLERLQRKVLLAARTGKRSRTSPRTMWRDYMLGPVFVWTLLGPVFVWSQQNYHRLLKSVRYFKAS